VSERISDDDLAYFRRDMSAMDGDHVDAILDEVIERRAADLTAEERGALAFARKVVGASETLFNDRMHDPKIAAHMERCRVALVALDKLLGGRP